MHLGIRYQLLFPLAPLLVAWVAATIWAASSAGAGARDKIEREMDQIVATLDKATFPRNVQTLRLMKGLSGADLLLCDRARKPLRDDMGQPLTTLDALPDPLPEDVDRAARPVKLIAGEHLCRAAPLAHDVVYLFLPMSVVEEAATRARRPAWIVGLVGGAAAVLATVLLAHRMTRRIRELQRRTRLLADGDFSPMPLPTQRDELRDLGSSVNEMAARLAQMQTSLQQTERLRLLGQVSGGLAHQLRNGVAGARLAIQLHVRETGDAGESLRTALRQLSLVEICLKRFLEVGKTPSLRAGPVDLRALATETLDLLGPQCQHANIAMGRTLPEGEAIVSGDADALRQAFLNLLANAIDAAGPGGTVEASLTRESAGWTFAVRDSGPGPTPEIAARLFEPFVTGKPEGVGLGLASTRQIATAHGGTVSWARESGTTCFRLNLPGPPPN